LAKCKRIFGDDLVVGAWVTTYDFGRNDAEVQERLQIEAFTDNGKDDLSYDGQDILVEFSSGAKVIFHNSEWASIYKLKMETYLA
jgi:hypothetical protein